MIAVVGCGRVGLSLALCLAARGERVLGVEIDPRVRAALGEGRMPFTDDFTSGLLQLAWGRTFALAEDLASVVAVCDSFVIALGTPLGADFLPEQEPLSRVVLSIIQAAAPGLGRRPEPPLIVLRSTVTPGTTDGLIRTAERELGLLLGRDFLLAVCPERTLEGHSEELLELPQIIGTREDRSAGAAAAVFRCLGVELVATGLVEAELAKLYDNAHRYVSFALSNELMMVARAHGARPHEAFRAANHNYKRGGIPGPGYASGPCLVKDGLVLGGRLPAVGLLLTGWRINESLPEYFIQQIEAIRPLTRSTVLGLAFKADSDDSRNSLGLKLVELLRVRGVETVAHDPFVGGAGVTSDLERALRGAGEVFVTVPHRAYRALPWRELGRMVQPGCIVADPWSTWGQDDVVVELAGSKPR